MMIKIKPITIDIADNWRYCLATWLVDRDDFLIDLQKTRKKLGINEKLVDYNFAKEWFKTEFEKERKRNPIRKIPEPLTGGNKYVFPKTESEKITTKLLEKYHKSPLYFEVIRYSIIVGRITDKEFARTAFCQVLPPDYQMIDTKHDITNLVDHNQPIMAIVMSPETKLEEVVRIFRKEVPFLRTEYVASYLRGETMPPDIIGNIQRDRKWYWLKKEGMSYTKVFEHTQQDGETITLDGVKKAIMQYRDRVSGEI